MNIDSTVIEDVEPGDFVLYKDYTEAPWSIGILHSIDKKAEPKHRYHVITQIKYDEGKLNTALDNLVQIYPYRYVNKLIVNK